MGKSRGGNLGSGTSAIYLVCMPEPYLVNSKLQSESILPRRLCRRRVWICSSISYRVAGGYLWSGWAWRLRLPAAIHFRDVSKTS